MNFALSESKNTFPLARSTSARHLPALDGLRGLAILLVLLFHMTVMTPSTWVDRAWMWFTLQGNEGVDVFFVLSGYLITGILLDSRRSGSYFKSFYARRILRIFPLYYAVVAFSLLILPHFALAKSDKFALIGRDSIWYWLHLSNFAIARRGKFVHGILDVSWSLAIEEQFYLIWPAVVFFLNRKLLTGVATILILSAPISRAVLTWHRINPIAVYTLTFCRTDGLAMGSLIAIAVRNAHFNRQRGIAWAIFAFSLPATFVVAYLATRGYSIVASGLQSTTVCIATAATVYLLVTSTRPTIITRIMDIHILRLLGVFSYALYLFHYPIMAVIRDKVFRPTSFPQILGSTLPGQLCFYILGSGVSLLAAVISWNLYEKQFLKLKRFFPVERIEAVG